MKIALLEEKTVTIGGEISFDEICSLGECVHYPLTPSDKVVEYIADADAVIINKTLMTKEVMEKCPNLKYIGLCATGYNNVDTEAANKLGITVTNCPSYSTYAVAQHVFAFILHFASKIDEYNRDVHNDGWINSDTFAYFKFPADEICGMTLGIVGLGSIGIKVAEIGKAFGMNVIAYTRTPKNIDGIKEVDEKTLFEQSDFITLHCPLTEETNGFLNIEKLSLCKKNAVVINTSRGPVVNENDLAYALNNDIIAGAAVDVISAEPMKADNPLYKAKNIIITPHCAWAPVQTRQRLMKIVADNLKGYINGKPQNVVNAPQN